MPIDIKDLGPISGKILVFGGIYSNLQALEALYKAANDLEITSDHIFCTGDIVGYCAQPAECIDFVQSWGIQSIKGNVEQNLLAGQDDCGCNFSEGGKCDLLSKQWYPYALSNITTANTNYLETLPDHIRFNIGKKRVTIIHGSALEIAQFIFRSTDWKIKEQSFNETHSDIILAGHCGIPFSEEKNDKVWLNAGVIGMPANDGTTDTWFMILDKSEDEDIAYSFHRLQYDYLTAAGLMEVNHLPNEYAQTLKTGYWDNCEILPEEEKRVQGKVIEL